MKNIAEKSKFLLINVFEIIVYIVFRVSYDTFVACAFRVKERLLVPICRVVITSHILNYQYKTITEASFKVKFLFASRYKDTNLLFTKMKSNPFLFAFRLCVILLSLDI